MTKESSGGYGTDLPLAHMILGNIHDQEQNYMLFSIALHMY
jgi:hypothetical protein